MSESLIEPAFEEDILIEYQKGRPKCRKLQDKKFYREVSFCHVPANSVPAAAVRQEGRALGVWTGPKAWDDGSISC